MLKLITAPIIDPITLLEAKQHLRMRDQSEDTLIASLIQSATSRVEAFTNRALFTQTWDLWMDVPWSQSSTYYDGSYHGAFYQRNDAITLPKGNLQSVSTIYTYGTDDSQSLYPASSYYVDTNSPLGRVWLQQGKGWPGGLRRYNAIAVRFVCGWTDQSLIPEPIRTAVRLYVAHMYENREGEEVPVVINDMLWPYKIMRVDNAGW